MLPIILGWYTKSAGWYYHPEMDAIIIRPTVAFRKNDCSPKWLFCAFGAELPTRQNDCSPKWLIGCSRCCFFAKMIDHFIEKRLYSSDPMTWDVPSHWVARKNPDLSQVIECPKSLVFHWSGPETSTPHFFSCGGFKSGPPQAFLVCLYIFLNESYHCRDANLKNPACGGLGCSFLNRASRGGGVPAPVPLSVPCPKSLIF